MVSWYPDYAAALVVPDPDRGEPGSGFALGEVDGKRYVVTAMHVVAQSPSQVEVWFHRDLYDAMGWYQGPSRGQGRLAELRRDLSDPIHDVAVLELVSPDSAEDAFPACPPPYANARPGDPWSALAFPDFVPGDGNLVRGKANLTGSVSTTSSAIVSLDCNQSGLGGSSGAAVLIHGALAGVLIHGESAPPGAIAGSRVWAVPLDVLLRWPAFPRPWEPSREAQWRSDSVARMQRALRADPALARELFERLRARQAEPAATSVPPPIDVVVAAAERLASARQPQEILPVLTAFMEEAARVGLGQGMRGECLFRLLRDAGPRSYSDEVDSAATDDQGRVPIPMQFGFVEAAAIIVAALDKILADLEIVKRGLRSEVRAKSVIPFPSDRPGLPAVGIGPQAQQQHLREEVRARMAIQDSDSFEQVARDVQKRVDRNKDARGGARWLPALLVDGREDVAETVAWFQQVLEARVLLATTQPQQHSSDRERCITALLQAYQELLGQE